MNNLRKLRRAADKSQLWLMKRTGIHFSIISKFEHGWLEPSERQKKRLARALSVSVESLFPESSAKDEMR